MDGWIDGCMDGWMMGREKYEEGKEQPVIRSTAHHVSNVVEAVVCHGEVWLPVEQAQ